MYIPSWLFFHSNKPSAFSSAVPTVEDKKTVIKRWRRRPRSPPAVAWSLIPMVWQTDTHTHTDKHKYTLSYIHCIMLITPLLRPVSISQFNGLISYLVLDDSFISLNIPRVITPGIFKPCHSVVDPEPYFGNCVYDMCATGGQTVALCQAIESYADMCAAANVPIPWRNNTFCRKSRIFVLSVSVGNKDLMCGSDWAFSQFGGINFLGVCWWGNLNNSLGVS